MFEINTKDFVSFRLRIEGENNTSKTPIPLYSAKRPKNLAPSEQDSEYLNIVFVEFLENGMILDMAEKSCNRGHLLRLMMKLQTAEITEDFSFDVTVAQVEVLQDQRQRVEVHFTTNTVPGWDRFQSLFAKRQEEIDQFLREAKG